MWYVEIDVRGKMFSCHKEKLIKCSGYFKTLFESQEEIADPIVLDRDPVCFMRILDYIKTEAINFPEDKIDEFEKEGEFFQIDFIVELCRAARKKDFNIPHVQSQEEILAAVRDSKKKAVIIMTFRPDFPLTSVQIANCLLKYGHFMDLFFRPHHLVNWGADIKIYDKTNFNVIATHSSIYEQTLWQKCPHLVD